MSNNILDDLEKLIEESTKKRVSFLIAITKSSRSISAGANDWFKSEVDLLRKEMEILESVMPEDVQEWRTRLNIISTRFQKAISFLNGIITKAEKGELTSIREVQPPPPPPPPRSTIPTLTPIFEEKEEEKKLDLVSAILEVFDSASDLEKLINEVDKESKRTIRTARLTIKVLQKKQK